MASSSTRSAGVSCTRCDGTASCARKRRPGNSRNNRVSIWNRVFGRWPGWRLPWTGSGNAAAKTKPAADGGAAHLTLARESLRDLIEDRRLPAGVRESLAGDYAAVRAMLENLEHGHVHIAVFGRVGTGKSSLLNALVGERRF